MSVQKNDPYSVLLRRNKLPMSLLDDSSVGQKVAVLFSRWDVHIP